MRKRKSHCWADVDDEPVQRRMARRCGGDARLSRPRRRLLNRGCELFPYCMLGIGYIGIIRLSVAVFLLLRVFECEKVYVCVYPAVGSCPLWQFFELGGFFMVGWWGG